MLCTSETATNPEIAALQQHQDPASEGAAELNKQITLDLAVQLASIGADPQLALQSGTFAPGEVRTKPPVQSKIQATQHSVSAQQY